MAPTKRMKTESPITGPELPDEIMTEVLLRLPVKSILRFRAVCRAWAATLCSDEFCTLHMARETQTESGAPAASARYPKLLLIAPATAACDATVVYSCSPPCPGGAKLMLTLDDLRGDFVGGVAAQCRGLILLHDAVAPAYYVVNAATRAVTRLPPCQKELYSSAGLGFDARAKEYKVMRLLRKPKDPDVSCEVYTLGGKYGDTWRPAAGRIPSSFSTTAYRAILCAFTWNLPPVLANGSLHWLIGGGSCSVIDLAASIITYSVTEETFGWVQSPPCGTSGAHLVELDGCLCMVRDLRHGSPDCSSALEIWKLQDYNSGVWSLDTHIDLSHYAGRNLVDQQVIRVLGAVGDGRSVTKKIIMATSGHTDTVHSYDALSKNVKTILSVADTGVSYTSGRTAIRICLFRETLAPVHKTHEEISFSSPLAKATKEILLRLPARSIVQFKRVSKQWRRFIEDKRFIQSYFAHKSMEKRIKIKMVSKGCGRRKFFHFAPLEKWQSEAANKGTRLDSKVVCSKPCHGLNLLITGERDYLYNPCTGYWSTNSYPGSLPCPPWETPTDGWIMQDHAFTIGNKSVGLGFNPRKQEHVAVIMLYEFKNFISREYILSCSVWHCRPGSGYQEGLVPPLPVNNMPPAYVAGVLYWMSDPLLGPSSEYAIVSFDIATDVFDVISCPPDINVANWSSQSTWHLFVVELVGKLCVVLADLMANELVIWKMEHDEWDIAYVVCLKASPDYSLVADVVMPLAVDPKDGRILLSTGRKMGFYDPVNETIEELYDADEILLPKKMTGAASSHGAPCEKPAIPLVPMLYEESLVSYPRMHETKWLR
uniref:F-box domain-containing protein n=2 Tax=Setaria viridis TaxID=4556 RepID=A0A4V6DD81_SETVI|nr:hypothetical protein SEVIR_1G240100v2 [Setaria viridis]